MPSGPNITYPNLLRERLFQFNHGIGQLVVAAVVGLAEVTNTCNIHENKRENETKPIEIGFAVKRSRWFVA